ncbi:MAG TPA: hypothetical protein VGL07_13350 [Buttiauxella sp.]|jgi:secreted effector protein SseB
MSENINIASSYSTVAVRTAAAEALTAGQILLRLGVVADGNSEAARPAGLMMALINGRSEMSLPLAGELGLLLQQQESDETQLAAGLMKMLAQYGGRADGEAHAVRDLARWLGGLLAQGKGEASASLTEKQSASVLRQLGQGNFSEPVKVALEQLLQTLRQSGAPLAQSNINDGLQTLLQQVRQETNMAHGQNLDALFTRNLAEFALRLYQQQGEDSARQMQYGHLVQARQQSSGQQQQRQQRSEEETEEPEASAAVDGVRSALSTSTRAQAYSLQTATATDSLVTTRSGTAALNAAVSVSVTSGNAASATSGISLYAGDSVFSYGLSVLFIFMQMLADQANGSYADMESNSKISRDAQQYATAVDGILANVAAKGDTNATGVLPDDVRQYIEDNFMEISGVCGYDSDGKWGWTKDTSSFNQGELTAIKGALDNVANRASDFISTAQLQLQKMMQTYNVCVSLINSLQTMLADMNKTIAQGIR